MLLDDPAAGLDKQGCDALGRVLRQSAAEGMTVIVVEHNLDFVLSIADVMYVMREGRVIATGNPQDVLRLPEAQSAFLGGVEGFVETTEVHGRAPLVQPGTA